MVFDDEYVEAKEPSELDLLRAENKKLKDLLEEEETACLEVIDERDSMADRVDKICAALNMSEEDSTWSNRNDPSIRAEEYIFAMQKEIEKLNQNDVIYDDKIILEDGKYTIILPDNDMSKFRALRHGEE